MTRAIVIAAWIVALHARAMADDSKAEAKQHVDRATQFHNDGKLAASLDELKTAYALDPQPQLLFAMGQIHVQLGECPQAIVYYERFLATKPSADAATVTREAIETCKTNPPPAIQTRQAPAEPVAAPATPAAPIAAPVAVQATTTPRAPWYKDYVGDGLVAGGVVAGVVGIVLYRSALSVRDDADHATDYQTFSSLVDRAHSRQTTALVVGIGGAALVVAGAVHLVLHRGQHEVSVVAGTAGTGASVVWSGRF
jgi:hypothetical protein